MSTNKRRKVEGPETPRTAVSAIAARRRLADAASVSPQTSSPDDTDDTEVVSKTGNAFSALQALKGRTFTPERVKESSSPRSPQRIPDKSRSEKKPSLSGTPSSLRTIYSSFKLNKQNAKVRPNGLLELRLDAGERFVALGGYGIQLKSGHVSIFGANILPSENVSWAHASHCHAVPVVRVHQKSHVMLHQDPAFHSLQALGNISPLFGRIWHHASDDDGDLMPPKSTFRILYTSENTPSKAEVQELTSPAEWNKKLTLLIDGILTAERGNDSTLICGPKSSGKSTFSKFVTNRLLTSSNLPDKPANARKDITGVAILDLDPGQPEYAPAGTLSLVHATCPNLGTPFTHPSLEDERFKVIRCHAIASNSPASAPELYLECVFDLFETYRRTLKNCPLVINTPGWVLGTGLDLMAEIIRRINPSEVVYLSEDGPLETVESLQSATKRTFSTLPSQPSELSSRSAANFRAMQTLSYFHSKTTTSQPSRGLEWSTKPVASMRPWLISYSGQNAGITGIISYDFQAPLNLLADSINGMILAVVEIEDKRAFRADAGLQLNASGLEILWSPEGLPAIQNANDSTLNPQFARTMGLALIRGINVESKCLQIITPISAKAFQAAHMKGSSIVLVHGKFDTPTWAYTEDIYERTEQSEQTIQASDSEDDSTQLELNDDQGRPGDRGTKVAPVPWLEVLHGNQKRPVGSKVWRVRRDLGRNSGD